MRRYLVPALAVLIGLAGVFGYWMGRSEVNRLRQNYSRVEKINQELSRKSKRQKVALFYTKSTPTRFYLQPVIREIEVKPDIYQAVVNAVLEGPPSGEGLSPLFPKGAKSLDVEVTQGLAVVNLNQQATRLNVGSEGELLAIASIVNSLTKLPDVYQVKIIVEGEEVESLAGHVDLTQIFTYNPQVVK